MPKISDVSVELAKTFPVKEGSAINITARVYSLSLQDSLLFGDIRWRMELLGTQVNSEEETIFGGGNLALRLSQNRDGVEQTTGWRLVTIRNSGLYYQGSTPLFFIEGEGMSSLMKQKDRWRAFKDETANTVFDRIANEYGLIPDIAPITTLGTWYQLGETDWDFLQSVKKEIVSATGQQAMYLQVHNKALRLKAIKFDQPVVRSYGIGTIDDRAEEIEFKSNSRLIDRAGGSLLRVVGFDIDNKRAISIVPPTSVLPSLAGKLSLPYGSGVKRKMSTLQNSADVTSEAINMWTDQASKYFSCNVSGIGDVNLKVGDIMNVQAVDPSGETSAMNGKYPIYEVIHKYNAVNRMVGNQVVEEAGITSHIGGYRRSFHYGNEVVDGANRSKVVSRDNYLRDTPSREDPVELVVLELS
jgi:hypothetical protein